MKKSQLISLFDDRYTMSYIDCTRLLLPNALAYSIGNEREAEEAAKLEAAKIAVAVKIEPKAPAQITMLVAQNENDANPGKFFSIRLGTPHDFSDAVALADRMLPKSKTNLDNATFEFSRDMFVGVSLSIAYSSRPSSFKEMLEYLVDPCWDNVKQLTQNFQGCEAFRNNEGLTWLNIFMRKTKRMSFERLESLIKRIHFEWQTALSGTASKRRAKPPRSSIQVFNQEAVSKAYARMDEINDEKKNGGDHILENAKFNNGYRTVPDARKAWAKLETEKSRFENLMEPIGRLQMDLLLAAAMKPEDFYVTPILLLGDPGIGKTYLATQLADSLGVAMEKISAGGAQSGFQITGSHSTYLSARPGSLTAVLAAGTSASPVFVIDEIDKIVDGQHPVLPVLLDLFEPNTAKNFKDEFLGLEYDASRVIFILTANTLDGVPLPLLSRVEVFEVPRPAPAQRLRIIQDEAEQLRRKTRKQIELDEVTSQILAERADIDLRKTTRLVKEAFTKAMVLGNTVATMAIPKTEDGRRSIGFGC